MTPEQFTYWLQGWTEMEQNKRPNVDQWNMIVNHLALVLNKVTPALGDRVAACGDDDILLEDMDLDDMTDLLEQTIEDLNNSPDVVFDFIPHHPQVTIPDTLICSNGQPDTESYCSALPPILPRKLHND